MRHDRATIKRALRLAFEAGEVSGADAANLGRITRRGEADIRRCIKRAFGVLTDGDNMSNAEVAELTAEDWHDEAQA